MKSEEDADEGAEKAATGECVEIGSLSSQGAGVGRLADGRVVFVDGAAPNERVRFEIVEARKRFVRARVSEIVEKSEARVEPRCVHFGQCGGCLWQHVRYAEQLEAKRTIVHDALARIGGIELRDRPQIEASPDAYAYRARARWVEFKDGIGFRARGSRHVSPVTSCPVLVPAAEEFLQERVQENAGRAANEAEGSGGSDRSRRPREWVVTAGSNGSVIASRAGARRGRGNRPPATRIDVAGERFRVSAQTFVQGNALLWDTLVAAVREACLASDSGGEAAHLAELYCGMGFFTIPLARTGSTIVGLESDRSALADLRYNLRVSGLAEQVQVLGGLVEDRGDLEQIFGDVDIVLMDPPRAGLHERVRDALCRVTPKRLVYLSCDPATLARDLEALLGAGYQLSSIKAFDLFPQTPHVETLTVLQR